MGVMYEVNQSTGAVGDPVLDSSTGSGGGGGLTQEEHDALMSIASMPAKGDFNPDKLIVSMNMIAGKGYASGAGAAFASIPIEGFDKVSLYNQYVKVTANFLDSTGATISSIPIPSLDTWTDYVDVPSNAKVLYITIPSNSSGIYVYGSFLTADSPYNPDNQNP